MSFPKYQVYKESGVEWLGAVPNDWIIRKVSVDFSATKGPRGALLTKEYCHENPGKYPVYSGQTENGGVLGEIADFDFDLGMDGAILSTTVGAKAMSVSHIVDRVSLSQNCMIIKSTKRDISIKFFFYHFQPLFLLERRLIPDHMQPSFRMEDLYSFRIAVPPESEQTHIARFLDHETARIDALIEEQQRLIELLKEKRQAVISHAVTRGLDPKISMKDSGVEWLGEVPAHWDILNFNLLVYIAEGQVDPKVLPYSEMTLIAPNHVESATGRLHSLESAEEQGADSGKYLCQKGDVVYSKIRPALRKVCVAPTVCLCSADMYPMRGHSGLENQYLLWFILSEPFSAFALLESDRVAMPKINRESLGGLKLARPPLQEQRDIERYLSEETRKIDELIDEALLGVGLLNERRSALISATVTGKIDIRSWQQPAVAALHESVEEVV